MPKNRKFYKLLKSTKNAIFSIKEMALYKTVCLLDCNALQDKAAQSGIYCSMADSTKKHGVAVFTVKQ